MRSFCLISRPACGHARSRARSLILSLVRRMSALRAIAFSHLIPLAFAGCSAVGTATPQTLDGVPINSEYANALTPNDQLQIRRLLTSAGICLPVGSIDMHSADRATLDCGPIDAHPERHRDLGYWIQVTLLRRHGRWFIDRDSIHMTGRQWGA